MGFVWIVFSVAIVNTVVDLNAVVEDVTSVEAKSSVVDTRVVVWIVLSVAENGVAVTGV